MSETSPAAGHSSGEFPVESNRRLLSRDLDPSLGIEEYFDMSIGSRVISMPINGEQARSHEELHERRLPVFSAMYRDDKLLLLVPDGTRPLSRVLRSIARDLRSYGNVFSQFGTILRQLDVEVSDTGLGLPDKQPGRDILDQFAFVFDERAYGGAVSLCPPYNLDPSKKFSQVVNAVHMELVDSDLLSEYELSTLMQKMIQGWQA